MASSKARSRNRPSRSPARTQAAKSQSRASQANGQPRTGQPSGQPRASEPTTRPPASQPNGQPRGTKAKRQPLAVPPEPVRPAGPPQWLQIVSLVLAIAGLGVSAYETYAHYNGSTLLGCPSGGHGTFDCTAVITSSQSMVFGVIPVAILGLVFYVFVVAIMTPWAWRLQRPEVGWLRLGSMIVGMGFVMYLIYAELYQIGQVCEYCTGVHVITFLLFCITVVSAALWGLGRPKTAA